jgi:hypothetical protein
MRLQVLVAWMFLVAVPLRVGALTVLPATFEELVHESTAVVYGRVVSVEGRWSRVPRSGPAREVQSLFWHKRQA